MKAHETSARRTALATAWFSIVGNSLLAAIKAAAGLFGNSWALIADAIESTADVFASLLVLLGLRYSIRPPDEDHPYGHGRIEPLVTFAIVGFLLMSAAIIGYESVQHIRAPHAAPAPFTLFVLGAIIAVKEGSYRYVHARGRRLGSSSLQADAWHHRADALTSLTAFVGISIALLMGDGYESADDWAALVASGLIVFNAFLILRPALGELMDEQLHDDLIEEIRAIADANDEVVDTEKCYARKIGMTYQVDLHLIVDGGISVRAGHDIAHRLKRELQGRLPQLAGVMIHVEPDDS